jgi:hypothetical protein
LVAAVAEVVQAVVSVEEALHVWKEGKHDAAEEARYDEEDERHQGRGGLLAATARVLILDALFPLACLISLILLSDTLTCVFSYTLSDIE